MAIGKNGKYSRGKVAVTFGWDLLEKINEFSSQKQISFAEAVRRICVRHFDDHPNN